MSSPLLALTGPFAVAMALLGAVRGCRGLLQSGDRLRAACLTLTKQFSAVPAPLQEVEHFENPAAVLHGIHDLRFENHPLAEQLHPSHVRIAMKALGICGSDVHFLEKGRIGKFVLTAPMVIGHESAGEVVGLGADVTDLQVGDRVALEPQLPCWGNKYAREGRYNLADTRFFSTPPVHGALCKFIDHPADFCFKMPESLTYEQGAMVEPLSNAVHAVRRAGVAPGKKVAVLGCGPVGLMVTAAAKAFAASSIAVADIRPDNLPVAQELGAKHVLDLSANKSPEAAIDAVRDVFGSAGPDIVIDCAGFESTISTALEAVAPGGTIGIIGLGQERCCIPIMQAVFKEANVLGMFRYTNTYPLCLSLLEQGAINCEPLITHRYGFSADEVAKGFDTAVNAKVTKSIKVMFHL